jgi:putative ATP-binding cassette transporter
MNTAAPATRFRLTRFVPRHTWLAAAGAFGAGIAAGACGAGLIALINTALHRPDLSRPLLGAAFVALVLGKLGSTAFSAWLLNGFTLRTLTALCQDLSRRVLATPLRHVEQVGVHRILAALTDDIAMIGLAAQNVPMVATNVAVLVGCAVYLGWLSWKILVVVLVLITLGTLLHRALIRRTYKYMQRVRETRDVLFRDFRALTEGTKELKLNANRRDAFLTERIDVTTEALRRDGLSAIKTEIRAGMSSQLLFYGMLGGLLFSPAIAGGALNSETVIGYVLATLYMMNPLNSLMSVWPTFARARIAFDKVSDLGVHLASDTDPGIATEPTVDEWETITFEDVRFSYPPDIDGQAFELGPIDLTLQRGEMVFLIGGNGSGKSTLIKVLTGLYAPDRGSVRIDDRPITDTNRESYRQLFAAIFSDFYLFDTLLGLGKDRGRDAARFLAQLELDGKVRIDGSTLSTTALSQGQRKRLAMLTALLEDRPIYVFDEWAADQDPHYREIFYCHLLPELKRRGKTVVVITHDDRYFHVGDRIMKLDVGRLVAHAEAPLLDAALPA